MSSSLTSFVDGLAPGVRWIELSKKLTAWTPLVTDPISPQEFLRARRPDRFSDSFLEEGFVLDRSMLEYHLHSLTSRSQEADFERFARRLVEREVCPNLLPQTGPTGGGDSKVDAETYPVADDLSLV